jgi:ABC-type nitrate/sulfonate/bicarbonate transport system ATPase subunit
VLLANRVLAMGDGPGRIEAFSASTSPGRETVSSPEFNSLRRDMARISYLRECEPA